jgi:hypothetical protein
MQQGVRNEIFADANRTHDGFRVDVAVAPIIDVVCGVQRCSDARDCAGQFATPISDEREVVAGTKPDFDVFLELLDLRASHLFKRMRWFGVCDSRLICTAASKRS